MTEADALKAVTDATGAAVQCNIDKAAIRRGLADFEAKSRKLAAPKARRGWWPW